MVVDEPATADRPHRIRSETPLGSKSSWEFNESGQYRMTASDLADAGTPGEPQVLRNLRACLASQGFHVKEIKPASEDERNRWDSDAIDGKLDINGKVFDVQVTMVPADSDHWAAARAGVSMRTGNSDDAAQMIHDAIQRKKHTASPTMILALDARIAAITEPVISAEYLKTYGDPSTIGFAAIVLVGPTAHLCIIMASRINK